MLFFQLNFLLFFGGYLLGRLISTLFIPINQDINLIMYNGNPVIPKKDNIYFLSNTRNNLHVFVHMAYYDIIDYFYYIRNNCKIKKHFRSRIYQNLVETNKKYYAIENYGNSYFYDINNCEFNQIINKIPDCII